MATLAGDHGLAPAGRGAWSSFSSPRLDDRHGADDRAGRRRWRRWRSSLILLAGVPRRACTARSSPSARRTGRYGLGWIEPPGHPVRPRARRPQPLALRADVAADDHGDLRVVGVDHASGPPLHYAFLLALETGLLGLFASLDVVLFYIFFEFTLIPLFFLIGIWGGPRAAAGGGHVLPLHARRQPADAAGRDRAGGRPLPVLARPRAHLLDPRADARAWRPRPGPSGSTTDSWTQPAGR